MAGYMRNEEEEARRRAAEARKKAEVQARAEAARKKAEAEAAATAAQPTPAPTPTPAYEQKPTPQPQPTPPADRQQEKMSERTEVTAAHEGQSASAVPTETSASLYEIMDKAQEQGYRRTVREYAKTVDTQVVETGELTLPENLEKHREYFEKANEQGRLGNGTTFGFGTNRISVDVSSIKDEQQLAYFCTTLDTDEDKRAVMKLWADKNGKAADDVIFSAEEMLGTRIFDTPQTAQGALAAIGLVDMNGQKVDLRSADFQSVVTAAQLIPDKEARKQAFEYIKAMTRKKDSRFYGLSLEGYSADFRDSLDFPQQAYDDFAEELSASFYAAQGHEEENLRKYMQEYDRINGEYSQLSGAQKYWYTKALDAAFTQQVYGAAGGSVPDVQRARTALAQLDAARRAQEERAHKEEPEEEPEEEPGFFERALESVKEMFSFFDRKDEEVEPEEGPTQTAQFGPSDMPYVLTASAGSTPVPSASRMGRNEAQELAGSGDRGTDVPDERSAQTGAQRASEGKAEIYGPTLRTEGAPKGMELRDMPQESGGVNLVNDLAAALEYAHTGRMDQLDIKTRAALQRFYDGASEGTKTFLRAVTPEFYGEYKTGNEGAEYLWLRRMGTLGTTMNRYAQRIYSEDFPRELYGDAVMAISEVMDAADKAPMTQEEMELWGNRYEWYVQNNPGCTAAIDSVFAVMEEMRAADEAYEASVIAEKDAELERDRRAVASGQASAIQYQNVLNHAPDMDSAMAMRDPMYAKMSQALYEEFFSNAGEWGENENSFFSSWTYKTMKARGVSDLDDGESEYEMLLNGTMENLLLEDMRMAASVGQDLETFYAKQGGMSLEYLAERASAEIVRMGANTDEQEVAQAGEIVVKEGLGAWETAKTTAAVGHNQVKEGRLESLIMVAAATDIPRDVGRIMTEYGNSYGPLWGPTAYTHDMRAYAQSGKLPEELSKDILEYLDAGGDPYQIGIHPGDHAGVIDSYVAVRDRLAAYQKMIAARATEGEAKFIRHGSGVVYNAELIGETTLVSLITSPVLGPTAGSFLAMRTVYGSASQGKAMSDFMANGYMLKESLALSEMQVSAEAAANVTTLSRLTGYLSGYGALFGKGLAKLGGVKNPKAANALMKGIGTFFKTAIKELGEETIKDPLLEGVYSDALVGAAKSAIEDKRAGREQGALSLFRYAVLGVNSAADALPETVGTMIEEAPATLLSSLPFALLGAGGEVVSTSRSAKAAKSFIENPTAETAQELTQAVTQDAQDPAFVDELRGEMRSAEIEHEAAANMIFSPDPQLYDNARTTREQADSHKQQMEASQTRIEEGWKAYDDADAAGDVDGQLAALETVAKGRQGLEEHTREYEQKAIEAREAEDALVKEAHTRATASVNAQHEQRNIQAEQEQAERIAHETQARESGNVTAMDADAFIEANYPNASEADKQLIRDRFVARSQAEQDVPAVVPQNPEARIVDTGDGVQVQESAFKFAKRISKKYGTNIRFVKSLDGVEGMYDGKTIILAADATQGDVIKRVLIHEMTHSVEGTSHYKEMSNLLMKIKYGGDMERFRADIDSRMRRYTEHYKRVGRTDAFTEADAMAEIVADYNGELLSGNEKAIRMFVSESPGMARRMYEGIKAFINKLRGVKDQSLDNAIRVAKIFEKALNEQRQQRVQARETQYAVREVQPIAVSSDSDTSETSSTENAIVGQMPDGSAVRYSLRSWTDEEKAAAREALVRAGYTAVDAERWIADTDSIAAVIAADKDRLDFEAADNQVMLKPNQEYVKTLDASTLCAKRLLYQGTFDAIQHALPDHAFTSEELLDLLNLMKDEGYETPCGVCYVESRRRHLGKYASEWLESYDAKGGYQPKLDDVTTTDGLERMRHEHPEVYQSFVDTMNSKGSSNPKVVQLRTDYRGDIRRMTKSQIQKVIRIGGLRVQSFSDFETPHLLDMMQAVLDMAGRGLTSQAYTKVPNFAWVFGDTGIKINLSLMAEGRGVDADGNLVFSNTEGMDIDEAIRLRDHYSKNVGTVLVGANDDHIKAAMIDPRIDYIIPFHRSGWGKNELQKIGVLQTYTDYQDNQNERRITGHTKSGDPKYSPVKEGNFYPIDYWDYEKSGDENAATYLRMCEEDDRVPKFEQFLAKDADGHWVAPDGYWKLLIDFKMYDNDGVGAPQRAVTPDVNMDEAMRVLDEYEGGANELPVAQDVVARFVDEISGKAEGRVRYSLKGDDVETMHIKDQIRQNQKRLNEMDPVANIHVLDDMPLRDRKQQKRWVLDNLRDTGYKVDRQNFGVIEFNEKQIDASLNYLNTPEEVAAFLLIPRVLKRGVEIHQHRDHKDRGFPTVTIAAPVTINGKPGNMGIVVKRMDKNRYKTHRILMPDGSAFAYEKEKAEPTPAGGAAENGPHDQRISSATLSIAKSDGFDKRKYSLPSDNSLDAEIDAWMGNREAELDAMNHLDIPDGSKGAQARGNGERQFATQTAQESDAVPEWLKRELWSNPEQRYYDRDTNDAQLLRAWRRIRSEGYEATRDRLLQTENFTTEDNVEANVIMAMAFRDNDVDTALQIAHRYNTEGTKQGQTLQARKLFSRMTPTGIKRWAAGKMEQSLDDHMRQNRRQRRRIDQRARQVMDRIKDLQNGDETVRLLESGGIDMSDIDSRWGIPINDQQRALIEEYDLGNVRRPGLYYNRATTRQRMLEAILQTPNPLELTGNGLNLIQRLEYLRDKEAVITNADLNYIGQQLAFYAAADADTQQAREGDLALSRAYEAYGNITPATIREKMRTWRYTSMLLSIPSAERNIIGNTAQNALNAVSDGLAVELDRLVSVFTHERTRAHLSVGERIEGWQGFVEETKNTFRDFFTDRTVTQQNENRFNLNQRGRVYQNQAAETMRLIEGYLMSVGDRNFWRKKFLNSMAEQQRVADLNGVELDYDEAVETAEAEANYATFNEDGAVRRLFSQAKQIPLFGDVLDFVMPFTGVPTNIVKRMWTVSPGGLVSTALWHGWRAVSGRDFNQRSFVDGMSRGLTGSALFAIGMLLMKDGLLELGTGEEEDKRLRDLHAAQEAQYSPYIRVGDENISLAAFAPSVSPIIMGATAHEIFKDDEESENALINACLAGLDQIFDASYMSALKDIFSGYGSPSEKIFTAVAENAVSQNVPSVLSQIATAMDPYTRDTKDKNYIMQALKSGLIAKIPVLREKLLPEKIDITGKPVSSKEGIRNFIDPFTTTKAKDDPVLNELERLATATGSACIPHASEHRVVTTTGHVQILAAIADNIGMDRSQNEHKFTLNAEDRVKYSRMYYEFCYEGGEGITGIRDLLKSPEYLDAGDGDKAAMIEAIRTAAKMATQKHICRDRGWKVD